jgi:hypothetical protein
MYGLEGRGFFVSFHIFTRYVKVTFFRGTSPRPANADRGPLFSFQNDARTPSCIWNG